MRASHISTLWEQAKANAAIVVNTEHLDANWQTGRYIVEFEQGGDFRAKYGDKLLVNLSKGLKRLKGKGFSKSNLVCMCKLYWAFPQSEPLSHQIFTPIHAFALKIHFLLYLKDALFSKSKALIGL